MIVTTTNHTVWTGGYVVETTAPAEQPCLFDSIPEEDKNKPMLLSCPCPKCSPRCY